MARFAGFLAATLLMGNLCFAAPAAGLEAAPPALPAVTNIAQLRSLVETDWRARCDLHLEGVVCSVSLSKEVLILADESGAELFDFEFGEQRPAIGQRISLVLRSCEVTRRREGLALGRAPLVENDWIHPATNILASAEIEAGWIPIRVEWFNDKIAAILSVSHAEPGEAVGPIPDSALARSVVNGSAALPGLAFDCYEGGWAALPDFGRLPVKVSGTSSNFDVNVRSRGEYVGLVFSGWFHARSSGRHTFGLHSDDGSRLILGSRTPAITVLGTEKVPTYRQYWIGQVVGNTDAYVWTRAHGDVRRVELRDGRMELDLRSPREARLEVEIMDSQDVPPALLLNNRVSVIGVSRRVIVPGGQQIFGLVTAASEHEMELVEAAAEVWAANPLRPIAQLPDASSCPSNGLVVHLQGKLEQSGTNALLSLHDETGLVLLGPHAAPAKGLIGTDVETLAFCRVVDGTMRIQRGFFRPVPKPGTSTAARLPLLTTAEEILRLKPDEAKLSHPVRLRGVITCLWPESYGNAVLQDATRGIFMRLSPTLAQAGLQVGDFWEVEGRTAAGDFAPILNVHRLTRLGEGRLPEPVRPFWDQLISGSLDAQYVEIEGIITRVAGDKATLLTYWGQIDVAVVGRVPLALEQYENRLVRLRGILLAAWDSNSGRLRVGELRLGGASVTLGADDGTDAFAVPKKTLGQLLRFDLQSGLFQRVRVTGQVVGFQDNHLFLSTPEGGFRVIANATSGLGEGDVVEVTGFPQIDGPSPVLHEAAVRKVGVAPLPEARRLGLGNLLNADNDALRVSAEAILLSQRRVPGGTALLELQEGVRTFVARTTFPAEQLPRLRVGSRLALTGIFLGHGSARVSNRKLDSFELLLSSPGSVQVKSLPPWWTLRSLLAVLAGLLVILAGAMLWVFQLRRRVEAQTLIIRQKVQQEATLEERTRIARELHDTLEQALAGVSFQLGALASAARQLPREAVELLERARLMVRHGQEEARRSVRNLRMFALEHGDLSGALEQMMHEAAQGLPIRTELNVQGTPEPLPGTVENHLLRIGQEAMTNSIKHAGARLIRFDLLYTGDSVELTLRDDGRGFEASGKAATEAGHFGLLGMRERANKMGGRFDIISAPGQGTVVTVRVPRSSPAVTQSIPQ